MPDQLPIPLNFNFVRERLLEVSKKVTDAASYVQSIPQSTRLSENRECLKHYTYLHELLLDLHFDCLALLSNYYDLQQRCTCEVSSFIDSHDKANDSF